MRTGENGSDIWYWVFGAAAAIALVGLFFVDVDQPEDTNGSESECEVAGRVTDPQGRPVTSFEFVIKEVSGRTEARRIPFSDPKGSFAFTLTPGTFVLTCSAEGFPSREERVTVHPRVQKLWLEIRLGK